MEQSSTDFSPAEVVAIKKNNTLQLSGKENRVYTSSKARKQ